jgi:hypothetical protein|tara:strand:+ start:127 stop:438 length:312 start_codon:yes stop_codon:yes gene_type:complete
MKNNNTSDAITNNLKSTHNKTSQSDNSNLVNDLESSIETTLNDAVKIIQNMMETIDTNIEDKNLKNETLQIMNTLLLNLMKSAEQTQKKAINSLKNENSSEEE